MTQLVQTSTTADGTVYGVGLFLNYSAARSTANTADDASNYIYCGQNFSGGTYTCYEGFISFDTSSIPTTATITSVSLSMTVGHLQDITSSDFYLEVRPYDWGAAITTADWIPGANLGDSAYPLLADGHAWYDHDADASEFDGFTCYTAFKDNIVKGGTTRLIIASSRQRLGNNGSAGEYIRFYSANYGSSKPTLTINYTDTKTSSAVVTTAHLHRIPTVAVAATGSITSGLVTKTVSFTMDANIVSPTFSLFDVSIYDVPTNSVLIKAYAASNLGATKCKILRQVDTFKGHYWEVIYSGKPNLDFVDIGAHDNAAIYYECRLYNDSDTLLATLNDAAITTSMTQWMFISGGGGPYVRPIVYLQTDCGAVSDSNYSRIAQMEAFDILDEQYKEVQRGEFLGRKGTISIIENRTDVIATVAKIKTLMASQDNVYIKVPHSDTMSGESFLIALGEPEIQYLGIGDASISIPYTEIATETFDDEQNPYARYCRSLAPIGYWRLGESSGTVARDECGVFPGVYQNSPTLGTTGLIAASSNTAATFNGSSQGVITGSFAVGDTFSFAALINRDSTGRDDWLFSQSYGYTGILIDNGNKVQLQKVGVATLSASYTNVDANTHHIVVTKTGNTVHIYVDGTESTHWYANGTMGSSAVPGYLAYCPANSIYHDGVLDEVAVWNRVLTPTEVLQLYSTSLEG